MDTYKLYKERGVRGDITVTNEDSAITINLGCVNREILEILEEGGVKPPSNNFEWEYIISKELATKLASTTMSIKKPIRHQKKIPTVPVNTNNQSEQVDAMDVLLGLAQY